MTQSEHGAGRTLPANGTTGQVPVVDPDGSEATDVKWADAGSIAFTPAVSGNWHTGNVPTNIAQALNAIAASVTISH